MDSRGSQPPFGRPGDRTYVHNPNHTPNPQHGPVLSGFGAPPPPQGPMQMPFPDPFNRRDPFRPAVQHERQGSYGIQSKEAAGGQFGHDRGAMHGAWPPTTVGSSNNVAHNPTATSAPHHSVAASVPPHPSAISSGAQMSYPFDPARRRSLGGHSPPPFFRPGLDTTNVHQPSAAFNNRNMPPPSSPQSANPALPYPSSRAPGPVPSRDLPSITSINRPGSSMSISALIGGSDRPSAPTSAQVSPPTNTAPSPSLNPMRPPSPRRAIHHAQYGRSQTPERFLIGGLNRAGEERSKPSSPTRAFGSLRRSPEQIRAGAHYSHNGHNGQAGHGAREARALQTSPTNSLDSYPTHNTSKSVPARPNSQPVAAPGSPKAGSRDIRAQYPSSIFDHFDPPRRQIGQDARFGDMANRDRRDRANTAHAIPQAGYSPPNMDRTKMPQPERIELTAQPTMWPGPTRDGTLGRDRGVNAIAREAMSGLFRPGFQTPTGIPGKTHSASGSFDSNDPTNRLSLNTQHHQDVMDGRQAGTPMYSMSPEKRRPELFGFSQPSSASGTPTRITLENPPRRPGEDGPPMHHAPMMQASRSFLGLTPDANRRTGRASPLPQAVQGAQAKYEGPGGDPSIKNEFGRMFAGLGSGLGSVPPTSSGTPTRHLDSPAKVNDHITSAPDSAAHNGEDKAKETTRPKKSRKPKDDDGKASESGESRTASGRSKRQKHTHPPHHHHHHPLNHHHHHNHDKDGPTSVPSNGGPGSQFSTLKFSAGQGSTPAIPPTHHHHHHHHHPVAHHHHHGAKTAPPPSIKKPSLTVVTQPLLDSVAHRPRKHLGSQLYEASLSLPPATTTPIDAKFHYKSQAKPIPRFEGQENCTFTIRVPRYYLKKEQREQICVSRSVWGTEIYTDDSDPIAAAIHCGWIRGDWGEDVDVTMLGIAAPDKQSQLPPQVMTAPASTGPFIPPPDMDLHITVLILPALQHYASTTAYGIKSRDWGNNHDGMSYKIEKLEWVDEGLERYEERHGEARRQRMAAALSMMALLSGPSQGQKEAETSRLEGASNRRMQLTA